MPIGYIIGILIFIGFFVVGKTLNDKEILITDLEARLKKLQADNAFYRKLSLEFRLFTEFLDYKLHLKCSAHAFADIKSLTFYYTLFDKIYGKVIPSFTEGFFSQYDSIGLYYLDDKTLEYILQVGSLRKDMTEKWFKFQACNKAFTTKLSELYTATTQEQQIQIWQGLAPLIKQVQKCGQKYLNSSNQYNQYKENSN